MVVAPAPGARPGRRAPAPGVRVPARRRRPAGLVRTAGGRSAGARRVSPVDLAGLAAGVLPDAGRQSVPRADARRRHADERVQCRAARRLDQRDPLARRADRSRRERRLRRLAGHGLSRRGGQGVEPTERGDRRGDAGLAARRRRGVPDRSGAAPGRLCRRGVSPGDVARESPGPVSLRRSAGRRDRDDRRGPARCAVGVAGQRDQGRPDRGRALPVEQSRVRPAPRRRRGDPGIELEPGDRHGRCRPRLGHPLRRVSQ